MIVVGAPLDITMPWLKICVTCDRYAPRQGQIGGALADAIEQLGTALTMTLRRVPCLSGCHHPGNVALGGVSRWKIRLHGVNTGDAAGIAALANRYARSPTGELALESWPPEIRYKLAVVVPPQ